MQDYQTTNLMLANHQSDASSSPNIQISSENCSSNHYCNRYKWGGNVGPTAIYRPFAKLPLTIPGAHDVHFLSRLQPRDQHPVAYIIAVPGPLFILSPRGTLFSYYAQVRMRIVTLIKYMLISLILFRYCSLWVFGFHVCRYLIIIYRHNPFRYILSTSM